jgi:hypothetical protein
MQARFCSGRLLRRALLAVALAMSTAGAQPAPKADAKKASLHRMNEMTLAGLQPGHDPMRKARRLYQPYQKIESNSAEEAKQTVWLDPCHKQLLAVDFDTNQEIQVLRAAEVPLTADCIATPRSPWKTGRGLRVGDSAAKVAELYGKPDSRSPSTKEGQPLELWYYAFDWAGADVPQVMEVLCTREADGKPGRVVEITLAGPSL